MLLQVPTLYSWSGCTTQIDEKCNDMVDTPSCPPFAILQGCGVEGTLPPSSPWLLFYGKTYVQGAVILLLK